MSDFLDDLVNGDMVGYHLFLLHELSTARGIDWDFDDPDSMQIAVTKDTAEQVYGNCREIMAVADNGLSAGQMKKIRAARLEAHQFLYDEANDPKTSIERKIALVKLTSKNA